VSAVGTAVVVIMLLGVATFVVGAVAAVVAVGITHKRATRQARRYPTRR
jgi:uncharacterized membrane protein YgaE (UPF0421/DUF939 family)